VYASPQGCRCIYTGKYQSMPFRGEKLEKEKEKVGNVKERDNRER
jgi:hypothetical protein